MLNNSQTWLLTSGLVGEGRNLDFDLNLIYFFLIKTCCISHALFYDCYAFIIISCPRKKAEMNSQIIVEKNICAAPLATSPTLVGVKNGEAMELEMISTPMDLTVSQYLSKFKCTLYMCIAYCIM